MATTLHGEPAAFEGGLREVGPGVFAWLQPNGGWGESNAGLVVGDGGSALIDTLWDRRLTRRMLDAMAPAVEGAPIQLVVNTHSDGDHWWGNAEVPAAAQIVTSQASLDAMREDAPPGGLVRLRGLTRAFARAPGPVGEMGRYVARMLAPFDFEHVTLRFPDRAFRGSTVEHAGGRELHLTEVGPAHTPGDLIVHVAGSGVAFGADVLFFGVTPVMWQGPVGNWLKALETLLALDCEVYVPGHGPPGGRAEVEALRDYWQWLEAETAAHRAAGRSALQAARAMIRSPGFAPFRGWLSPERIVISVTTVHRALSGKPPVPAGPPARARMFAQVAALARELETLR